jgi:hypothetical protein
MVSKRSGEWKKERISTHASERVWREPDDWTEPLAWVCFTVSFGNHTPICNGLEYRGSCMAGNRATLNAPQRLITPTHVVHLLSPRRCHPNRLWAYLLEECAMDTADLKCPSCRIVVGKNLDAISWQTVTMHRIAI